MSTVQFDKLIQMPRALNFAIQGMLSGVYDNTKEELYRDFRHLGSLPPC